MNKTISKPTLSLLALGIAFAVQAADPSGRIAGTDDVALTAKGRSVTIDVLTNDGDIGPVRHMVVQQRPRNGTARIVDNQVLYQPAPGFTGQDRFNYMVKGSNRIAFATVTVDVGEALVLSGKVTDGPIANATVNASVDGRDFTTQADANGDYRLAVIGTSSGMLTMTAQGGPAQPAVQFASVVGDFDRLRAEAGADGELSRAENNQVQVTNLSTAQANLLQDANNGAPITDDAQLVAARESLDNAQLLQQAAVIKLVVDSGYPLPAGVTNTRDLIGDPAALASFISAANATDPAALGDAMTEIAGDSNLTVPTAAADLLGDYTLVHHLGIPGAVSTGFIQGNRMQLAADGTGSFVTAAANLDPSVTWTFASGRAVLIPNAPVPLVTYPSIPGTGQVRQFVTNTRYEISKLFDGQGRDTLAVTTTQTYTYPDNPGLPSGTQTFTSTSTGIRDAGGIVPYAAAELVGTRSLWIAGTPYQNANFTGTELFTFAANGTGRRADGRIFTWSIDPLGRLLTNYSNGNRAVYSRLNDDGRKGEGVAAEWFSNTGTRSSAFSLSARVDGSSFSVASAERSWRSGFFVSRAASDPNRTDFFVVLDPARIGWAISADAAGTYPTRLGWTTNGGAMDATQYRNGANQPVHFCTVGVNGCYIYLLRRWRPVATDGNRVYVIEEFLFDTNADGVLDVTNQRGNYYDAGARPVFTP